MSLKKSRFYYRLGLILKIIGYGLIIVGALCMYKKSVMKKNAHPIALSGLYSTVFYKV